MFMSNFTFSRVLSSAGRCFTSLLCCNIDSGSGIKGSIRALVFVMLFVFGSVSMYGQAVAPSTFFSVCQEDAPPGPSEADMANLYMNTCGDTAVEVIKSTNMPGDDCDWFVEYTYDIKCGSFEEQIKIVYTGGDRNVPTLVDGAQVPQGGSDINACLADAPMGPSESDIADLYSDDCGDVVVTKSGSPTGDDCSWTAFYKYTIQDSCGNALPDLDIIYTGGDSEAPQLLEPDSIPEGGMGLNLCYADRPAGPSEMDIANLFDDNCGNVNVTKTFETKGSDCKWYVIYTYAIVDDCNNPAESIQITYSGSDSEDPVLNDVPKDAFYACIDEVPEAPEVTYTDNCDDNIKIEQGALALRRVVSK